MSAGSAFAQPPPVTQPALPLTPPAPPQLQAPPDAAPRTAGPTVSGRRDVYVIGECTGEPITLHILSDSAPAAIRTGDIAQHPAAPPPPWSLEWSKPVPAEAVPGEYQSAGRLVGACPRPGLYSVPLTLYDANRQASSLTITVVREVTPVLDVPASVTLGVERLFGAPDPVSFAVREIEPGAPEVRVTITAGELRSAAGEATGITLEPTNSPVAIRAGEAGRVMLAPSAAPGPGAYVTKLTLNSPALSQATTIEVGYRVRVSVLVLVLMLLLGIVLGWWVNLRLAARSALDSAVMSGLRAIQAMTRRVTPQRDPAVQQRLLAVANLLQSNLADAASPDEVNAHVSQAEVQAKEIETKAVESVTTLQAALQGTRAVLRPTGHALDDAVLARLGGPMGELDALQGTADGGDVEQTFAKLQDFTRDLPGKVMPELRSLLADMQSELGGIGPLPAQDGLEKGRVELQDGVRQAYAEQDLPLLIKAADGSARRLRQWMDLTLPAALAAQWRESARVLINKPALAQRLGFAAEQAEQLRRASRDPLTRLASLAAFRKTVLDALTDAADGDRAVEAAVTAGDVRQAARLLAKSNEPEPAAPAKTARAPKPAPTPMLVAPAPATAAAVRIKPVIQVGQDTLAAVRWIGERPTGDRIVWRCHPPEAASLEPTTAGVLVRPREAGFVIVSLEVNGIRLAEVRTYAGEVSETNFYGIATPERRSTRLLAGVATGLLTLAAGYAILEPGWYGTLPDLARAFVWGAVGQFALDRVRELFRPMLSKTTPV